MLSNPKQKRYFLFGLLAICTTYILYYLVFLYNLSHDMSLKSRHVVKFCSIIITYFIGMMAFRKNGPSWILQVWHICYGSIILLLLILGGYDWAIARTPEQLRIIADNLQEFLISPILFVAIGTLKGNLLKSGNSKTSERV